MPRRVDKLIALAAIVALALGLSSCGGGSEKTVATVGKSKVSQAMLDHWMGTAFGGDYRAVLGKSAPSGMVSDPPDYARCVSVAQRIVPKTPSGAPKLNESQLRVKCRQLNDAVREQALSYILSVLWRAEEGVELGKPATEREISAKLREVIYAQYRNPAGFRRMLAKERRTVADERFLLKRNILEERFLSRIKARVAKLGGGQQALGKLVLANNAKWTAKTSCSPGYRAWECKEAAGTHEASPSGAVVLERLSRGEA